MEFFIHLLILSGFVAILGISLNLVVGYTGLLSIAHAAFYGIGAYTTAILTTRFGFGFFPSVAAGMAVGSAVAFLLGLVLSKFRDDYYALVSVGFSVIAYALFLNLDELTRGPLGIAGIPKPSLGGISFQPLGWFLLLTLGLLAVVYACAHWITRSSFGRVLQAIREDEQAIQVFGYNTWAYKLVVFCIAAAFAAVAGSLYAGYINFVDPTPFRLFISVFLLAVVILGGLASLPGSLIGAIFLITLPELLRFAGFPQDVAAQLRQFIYGLLLVLLMLYRPQGILGKFKL